MDWIQKVAIIVSVFLIGGLFTIPVCMIVDSSLKKQSGSTNKRKEKYLKKKEKQIIEQLEFEKDVYVRKVIIEKRMYGYVFFTKVYAWRGKVYPQVFETLDELVEFIKKLEKGGKL